MEFDFPGKSGVRQRRELKDSQVATVVRSLLRNPGRQVFKYRNGDNEFVKITNRHINEYIKEIMGEKFSAKDFRTWAGTITCACALARAGSERLDNSSSRKRIVVAAIRETAEMLILRGEACGTSLAVIGSDASTLSQYRAAFRNQPGGLEFK